MNHDDVSYDRRRSHNTGYHNRSRTNVARAACIMILLVLLLRATTLAMQASFGFGMRDVVGSGAE